MKALIIIEATGKARAWRRVTKQIGLPAQIIATGGHICRFPASLFPLGIDLTGQRFVDYLRQEDRKKTENLLEAVRSAPADSAIVVAMDDDVEGCAIAGDVARIILQAFPEAKRRLVRARPGAITPEGVRSSLAAARRFDIDTARSESISGRARGVTDRLLGSTFSKLAGRPAGRIRTGLLGASYLLKNAPNQLIDRPETGEITFQARSSCGGRPFHARIPIFGDEDRGQLQRLMDLARRFEGQLVPGIVRPISSLGAAAAPRCGSVRPFNTAEALIYAARHHGIPVVLAMRGLQDAYEEGMTSHPRIRENAMSRKSASHVVMLGSSCRLSGLDAERLSDEGRVMTNGDIRQVGQREALHPVLPLSIVSAERLGALVRRPIVMPEEGWCREAARDLMVTIVSRRAFEAARDIRLERGQWYGGNQHPVDHDDAMLLSDLEWFRDDGFNFPWTRHFRTEVREWPTDSVLLDLMASEQLGHPASFAAHVMTALESGDYEVGTFPDPPAPSRQGLEILKALPAIFWHPETCRAIDRQIRVDRSENLEVDDRVRRRVEAWIQAMPVNAQSLLERAVRIGSGDERAA